MKRGDIVVVSLPGNFGKPRPALIVQADLFNDTHSSITLLPITSTVVDAPLFRMTLDPSKQNGLRRVSQLMIDKLITVRRERVRKTVGRINDHMLIQVNRALAVWIGIA